MIAELIEALPDDRAYLELLNRYDAILRKYARILNYEDAYEDLRVFFLTLVYTMRENPVLRKGDGVIVNYIVSSIKHQYVALSRSKCCRRDTLFSELTDEQRYWIENHHTEPDYCDISELFPIIKKLSEREIEVIKEIYVTGYSTQELANRYRISRQAVNQLKQRALKRIRQSMQL